MFTPHSPATVVTILQRIPSSKLLSRSLVAALKPTQEIRLTMFLLQLAVFLFFLTD
jgi:hypothetical protein